jgi:hypothetical protein
MVSVLENMLAVALAMTSTTAAVFISNVSKFFFVSLDLEPRI